MPLNVRLLVTTEVEMMENLVKTFKENSLIFVFIQNTINTFLSP